MPAKPNPFAMTPNHYTVTLTAAEIRALVEAVDEFEPRSMEKSAHAKRASGKAEAALEAGNRSL